MKSWEILAENFCKDCEHKNCEETVLICYRSDEFEEKVFEEKVKNELED